MTEHTLQFFLEVDRIFNDWDREIRKHRLWERHEPSTDFAMAMALANMEFLDAVSNTHLPTFVHNKNEFAKG